MTQTAAVFDSAIPDLARVIGDDRRYAILRTLMDDSSRPAGELGRAAGVGAATASEHLRRFVETGLIVANAQGRHRYYALAGPHVAQALEALASIAPPEPVRSLSQSREAAGLAAARTCYDHLAGQAGVRLRTRLLKANWLTARPDGTYILRPEGRAGLRVLGGDPDAAEHARRPLAKDCLDWTERQPHLSGELPAVLLARFVSLGAVRRSPSSRKVTVAGHPDTDRYLMP